MSGQANHIVEPVLPEFEFGAAAVADEVIVRVNVSKSGADCVAASLALCNMARAVFGRGINEAVAESRAVIFGLGVAASLAGACADSCGAVSARVLPVFPAFRGNAA